MKPIYKYGIIAGFLAYLAYSVTNAVRKFSFEFLGFKYSNIDNDNTVVMYLSFRIYNPTAFNFELNGIVSDIYINGMKVGYIDSYINKQLRSHSHTDFSVRTNIYPGDSIAALVNVMLYNQGVWNMTLDGMIAVDKREIPIKTTIHSEDFKE